MEKNLSKYAWFNSLPIAINTCQAICAQAHGVAPHWKSGPNSPPSLPKLPPYKLPPPFPSEWQRKEKAICVQVIPSFEWSKIILDNPC